MIDIKYNKVHIRNYCATRGSQDQTWTFKSGAQHSSLRGSSQLPKEVVVSPRACEAQEIRD